MPKFGGLRVKGDKMITYNFERYILNNDDTIRAIYWYMRDSDHPEEHIRTGNYTEVTLEEKLAPDEAMALVKSIIGTEGLSKLEIQSPIKDIILDKINREESQKDLEETG
jgi:hypothetical protein